MKESKSLELLFHYACEYKFDDFSGLLQKLEDGRSIEGYWEAYLMRAQIKLYAADATALDDLEKIARFSGTPKFPRLSCIWRADAPNRFIVFPKGPGALRGFLRTLPLVREKLRRWYGEQGDLIVRQIQGEIHYFLSEVKEALEYAEEQHRSGPKNNIEAILAQCVRFRCYLALSVPWKAEECMLDMIRLSQTHPECQPVYSSLRSWANLTTNWSGDTPRFYNDPNGRRMPILEDRLEGVRMGTARTTPLEDPFVRYAERNYDCAYALRQHYMDVFNSMYWFQAGDQQQMELFFRKVYQMTLESGIYMPLVECGEQLTPLFQYVKDSNWDFSQQWLDQIMSLAGQYEKGLNAYK